MEVIRLNDRAYRRFRDGSEVRIALSNSAKWIAVTREGKAIAANGASVLYETVEAAANALQEIGQGPAVKSPGNSLGSRSVPVSDIDGMIVKAEILVCSCSSIAFICYTVMTDEPHFHLQCTSCGESYCSINCGR
jgi:hypothetical protein